MRWLVPAGIVTFAALWVGDSSLAQEGQSGHSHAAPAEEGHEHSGDVHAEEHHEGEHAEHPPVYDGDGDGVEEDYNQPPLKELTAVRFLWALGLFVAFVFVMRKIAWGPLIAAFDAREARVKEAHAFVASSRTEIQDLIRQHEARIAESYEEVKEIVAAARRDAEQARNEMIAKAGAEARELQERTVAEIQAAGDEALGQLSGRVDDYTDLATQQILGRALRN